MMLGKDAVAFGDDTATHRAFANAAKGASAPRPAMQTQSPHSMETRGLQFLGRVLKFIAYTFRLAQ
jgi:hypothetical protein